MRVFESYLLMVISGPTGRLFFCKQSEFEKLDSCVSIEKLNEDEEYVLFLSGIPPKDKTYLQKDRTCQLQECRYCKGYGLVSPYSVLSRVYTLGLTPIRNKKIEWEEFLLFGTDVLFKRLRSIYNLALCREDICIKNCILYNICKLKNARRKCVPIESNELYHRIRQPYFDPPMKSGVFPLIYTKSEECDGSMYCVYNNLKLQGSGIVQHGLSDRPRLFVAPFKKSLTEIEIPLINWQLAYQYVICRLIGFGLRIKPFVLTPNPYNVICFGQGFKKVVNAVDFLWRSRPLIKYKMDISIEYEGFNIPQLMDWNLSLRGIHNIDSSIMERVIVGLRRIFGVCT